MKRRQLRGFDLRQIAGVEHLIGVDEAGRGAFAGPVVAGAVTGGGLTVIANAPNPAGQAILARFFPGGVSPGALFLAALPPTLVMSAAFMLTR